ncbi:otogelin [Carcharodon carcharias]|uniref:otogelin n=1 Tax=Carcharodon carcharias TaxID=13397 RepID=UPI001B7D92A0|nr:otogelin [Carcharodon carcharias]
MEANMDPGNGKEETGEVNVDWFGILSKYYGGKGYWSIQSKNNQLAQSGLQRGKNGAGPDGLEHGWTRRDALGTVKEVLGTSYVDHTMLICCSGNNVQMSFEEASEKKSNRIIRQKRDIISQGEQVTFTYFSVPNRGNSRDLICRTWGQYNYETFDGLYYYYPGNCTYTLVRECEQSQQSFSIQVHNDPTCQSSPYSCQRSVSLFFTYEGEIILQSYEVIHHGQSVQLPYIIGNLKFEQIAGYILVRHHHGFSMAWDGSSGVYIKMNVDYVGKICGLCGNFNGNMHDDLYTSYGLLTEDIAIFGNSWGEDMPDKKPCLVIPVNYPAPCSGQSQREIEKIRKTCTVLLGYPFSLCHYYVQPYPYMASCVNDLCMYGPDNTTFCGVLTEYARACAQANRPLHEWRQLFNQCVAICEGEFVHHECVDCCPLSCGLEQECVDSDFQCLDGCYCPKGLIHENGTCLNPTECPCMFQGIPYTSGSVIQEQCSYCICIGGIWNCTENNCSAECSVTGDIHFKTFDERVYTFHATCQYILAKSRNSGKFTISLQNSQCGTNLNGACVQSVSLVVDEDMKKQVTLTRSGEAYHCNQYRISLPYTDDLFEVTELSSMFVQIKTDFGVRLQYDREGRRLYVQVDARWKEDTIGLCGTFNDNIQDDFLSPGGMIESTPQLFANSWRISTACNPGTNIPEVDPCDIHQQSASYATEKCSIISGYLFASCHQYLSPELYQQQCKTDTCKCGETCMCSAVAHYARQCRSYGIFIDFRANVLECDSHCGPDQIYFNCSAPVSGFETNVGAGCRDTCENLLLNISCPKSMPCLSGCFCPSGLVKHEDECFKPNECPCLWKGKEYFPGDKVKSPCYTCVCQQGSFQCTFQACPSMCTAYGDRHYKTFDGVLYDFISACKVYLVKSLGTLSLSIIAENIDCYGSGIICRKALFISVGHTSLVFDDDSGDMSPSSVTDMQQIVHIWKAGIFTVIHFPAEEITILWDRRTSTHVQVGPKWQGKLSGLCGNFDMKTGNEMRTPGHMESPNPQEFGNSWTVVECTNSPDIRNPCNVNPLREPFAKKECGILLSEVFEPCHPVVDVTWFYSNCLTDTCACNRGGDCECFCTSVLAYAHVCCQHEIAIDWRTPTICPYDCEYYNKVLGKGPYSLVSYLDGNTVVAANLSSGAVFPATREISMPGILTLFMLTPGLYAPKPYDVSLVSLEVADKPNYFLRTRFDGALHLDKWEYNKTFQKEATFIFHKDAWILGYDAFESYIRPGFFVRQMGSSLHLMQYNHSEGFRHATLFQLAYAKILSPAHSTCEWQYETCTNPCIRTCRDPTGKICQTLPSVEGCVPRCPFNMVFDEDTQRCVYPEDCIRRAVYAQPSKPTSSPASPGISISPALNASVKSLTFSTTPTLSPYRSSPIAATGAKTTASIPTIDTPRVTHLLTIPIVVTTSTSSPPSLTGTTTSVQKISATPPTIEQALLSYVTKSSTSPASAFVVSSARGVTTLTTPLPEQPTLAETISTIELPTESRFLSTSVETKPTTTTIMPSTTITGILSTTPEIGSKWLTTNETVSFKTEPLPGKTSSSTTVTYPSIETKSMTQKIFIFPTSKVTTSYPASKEIESTMLPTFTKTTIKTTRSSYPVATVYPFSAGTVSLTTEKTKSSMPALSTGVFKTSVSTEATQHPSTVKLTTTSSAILVPITERNETTTPTTTQPISTERTAAYPLSSRTLSTTIPPMTYPAFTTLYAASKEATPTSAAEVSLTSSATMYAETPVKTSTSVIYPFPTKTITSFSVHSYPSLSTKGPETSATAKIFKTVSTPQSTVMTSSSTTEPYVTSKSTSLQPTITHKSTFSTSTAAQSTTLLETSSVETSRSPTTSIPTSIKVSPISVSTPKTTTASKITQLWTTTILPTLITTNIISVTPQPTIASGLTSKMTAVPHAKNATLSVTSLSATSTTPTSVHSTTEKVKSTVVEVGAIRPTVVLSTAPLTTETSTAPVNETSVIGLFVTTSGVTRPTTAPTITSIGTESVTGKTVSPQQLTSTTKQVFVSLNGTVATERKETSVKSVPSTKQPSVTTTSELLPYTLHTSPNVTSSTIIAPHTLESVEGPTVFSATAYTTALTIPPTSQCVIPFPQDLDECIKQMCVEGQIIQVNRSHDCPYIMTPPSCELLGFAVQVNGDKCCPQWECPCRCSILANLHVITFDGSGFGISGAASYVITSLANETITVGISECLSSQMTTVIQPQVNSSILCLTKLNITHGSNYVIIDRQLRRLNINSRFGYTPFRRYDFEIIDTGSMYTILTPVGINIQWFHSTGVMVIDAGTPNKKLASTGLCGYCDGNPINDLILKNGTILKKDDDPVTFIQGWTVASTETGIKLTRRLEVNCSTSNCSECFRMLQSETFALCHTQVSPEIFCELWIRDSLFVNNHCSALAAYVALCNKFNICVEWRKPDYCSFTCPANMIYQACVLTCEAKTCQNRVFFPSEDASCSILSEGCVCPEGTILHRLDSTLCIPEEKCACTDTWGLPHAAGETWNASLDGCCMYQCLENGTIVTVDHNCSAVLEPICRRSGEIVVSLASDKSCCPNKICACNQTVCESFAPQCAYGERLITHHKPDSCCPDYFCECDPKKCESDIPTCREDQTLIATRADGSCCLAYICMCGACAEKIPTCQKGEILTVDNNTTEMCCPAYQCVCEIIRCPMFQCPSGMKGVQAWSPDLCCPFHSCECACDTVPKPQCKLGEVLDIEQQHGNITANPCGCPEYKCGKDPPGKSNPDMAEFHIGFEGEELGSEKSDLNFINDHYKINDQVCINGERGILHPGQTIVEHKADGMCYTTQCTYNQDNKTGFYQTLVRMVNCSAQCEMNQVYIPPPDLTTCCGYCKNVSCLANLKNETTTLHKPGTSWLSNCVRYDCTDTVSGPVLITSDISCPPFNETACLKTGGSVIAYMDGCCKSCKEDVKSCQKVVVRMTIRKNDCRSNRPVNIVSCDGKCPSASIYNYSINTHARFCKCCREIGLQKRTVQLYCSSNATWVNYSIQEPTDCSCQWS